MAATLARCGALISARSDPVRGMGGPAPWCWLGGRKGWRRDGRAVFQDGAEISPGLYGGWAVMVRRVGEIVFVVMLVKGG